MHEPHSSGVRRITHFVRGEVVMSQEDQSTTGVPPTVADDISQEDQSTTGVPPTVFDDVSQEFQSTTGVSPTAAADTSQDDRSTGVPLTAADDISQEDQSTTGMPPTIADGASQEDQSTTGVPPTAADVTSQDNQAATGVPATAVDDTSQEDQAASEVPPTAADDTPHSQQPPNGSIKRMHDEDSRVSKRSKLDSPDKEVLDNIDVGTEFLSYDNLQDGILRFERNNFVQLYKRSSRSLTAYAKKCPKKKLNADLVFSEIDFACVHGGKNFKSSSKGHRPNQQ